MFKFHMCKFEVELNISIGLLVNPFKELSIKKSVIEVLKG